MQMEIETVEENPDKSVYDPQQSHVLGIDEYLRTISIPKDHRGHVGVDSGWTRIVRTGTIMEQVEQFCSELRVVEQHPVPSETPMDQIIPHPNAFHADKKRQHVVDGDNNNSSTMSVRVLGNTPKASLYPSSKISNADKGLEGMKAQNAELPRRRETLKNPLDSETKRTLKEIGSDIQKRVLPGGHAPDKNKGDARASPSKELSAFRSAKNYLGHKNEHTSAKGDEGKGKLGNSPKSSSQIVSSIASENDHQLASQDPGKGKSAKREVDVLYEEKEQGGRVKKRAGKDVAAENDQQLGSDMSQSPEKKKVEKGKIVLPPRLQAMKEKIQKMKQQQKRVSKNKEPPSGQQHADNVQVKQEKRGSAVAKLQMTTDFDPRKMVLDDVRKEEPTPTNLFLQNIFSRKE